MCFRKLFVTLARRDHSMGVTLVMVSLGALVTITRAQGVHSPVLGAATAVRADYTVHSHDKKVSIHCRRKDTGPGDATGHP